MGVPKTPFDVARSIRSPLTAIESIALQAIKQIASEGRIATKAEIGAAIGTENIDGGTVPGVVRRLEQKGFVTRHKYQRGLKICLVESGICTAEPKNLTPHWRDCPERVPAPTIQAVRQSAPKCAALVEKWAREKSIPVAAMLEQLVHDAIHDRIARENERWD